MIAKLARGIFSCVAHDVMTEPAAILIHAPSSSFQLSVESNVVFALVWFVLLRSLIGQKSRAIFATNQK